jgi:sarcosine oxidase subunit beta
MRGEIVGGVTIPGHGPDHSMASSLEFLATYARRLTQLLPIVRDVKILRAWAGPYDQSPDGNPILDHPPELPDFFLACGFVGHGFMMAPVVGELYADYLTGGDRHDLFAQSSLGRFRGGTGSGAPKEDFNLG